jgi:hypothetical protein
MNTIELIEKLDAAWDSDGFLDNIRHGYFDPEAGKAFVSLLKTVYIGDEELIPKRLLSQLWYLPSFLEWQKERVAETSGVLNDYKRFIVDVHNSLEIVIGVP